MTRQTLAVAALFLCLFKCSNEAAPGILYTVTETCDHVYGTVLHTIPSVPSLEDCAGHCSQLKTCQSALYNTTSTSCTLNDATVETWKLPPDCGLAYLAIEGHPPVRVASNDNFGSCKNSSECLINGSVCTTAGICQCDTELTFVPEEGVCSSATNRSDCRKSHWCFPAAAKASPWSGGLHQLMVEMACKVTRPLPSDVITRGKLRIAVLTNVPAVVRSFDFVAITPITDREMIFTNRWNATNPYTYSFHVTYYGHVLSWDGATPLVDTELPEAQCRLAFL